MKKLQLTKIRQIQADTDKEIEKIVCKWLLENSVDCKPTDLLEDLLDHGCASCMVEQLITCRDTHAFFDEHYDEIVELRDDYNEEHGEELPIGSNIKNDLAWFAFEETTRRIAQELQAFEETARRIAQELEEK